MDYFTADLHLGHANIIKYCNRPFNDINEMNTVLINNILKKVHKNDTLWCLGDTALHIRYLEMFLEIMDKHNIVTKLIKGNHDPKHNSLLPDSIISITCYEQALTLSHYPMTCWNKSHYNAWMLYGHIHNAFKIPYTGKLMNVGVDVNNLEPVSFIGVKSFMDLQPDNFDFGLKNRNKNNQEIQ